MKTKPKIAVSACLIGQNVRHDGTNAEFQPLSQDWARDYDLIHTCPELEVGLGVPRSETKLVKFENKISLIDSKNGDNYTEMMLQYAQTQSDYLIEAGICGFVFKSGSASCGLSGVSVQMHHDKTISTYGKGLFAMVFTTLNPHIPVIEENLLKNHIQAEHYLSRVAFFNDWQLFGKDGWTIERINRFHLENEYFFLSVAPELFNLLNKLIINLTNENAHPETIALEYMTKAQKSLSITSRKGAIANTMELVLGSLSEHLSVSEMQEMVGLIDGFRTGKLPSNTPVMLLNQYIQTYQLKDKSIERFISSIPIEMEFSKQIQKNT